jgi:hypothetical protein
VAGGQVDGHGPAVALHDEQLAPIALAGEIAGQLPQVAVDDRLHEAVDRRRRPRSNSGIPAGARRPP